MILALVKFHKRHPLVAIEEPVSSILPAAVFCEQLVPAVVSDIAQQTKPPLEYQPLFKQAVAFEVIPGPSDRLL
jgi:hypothetical protein